MSNPDIIVAGVVVYVGEDQAARQEASIVTGSMLAAKLIAAHQLLVQKFINGIVDKLRWVFFLIAQWFSQLISSLSRAEVVDEELARSISESDFSQIFHFQANPAELKRLQTQILQNENPNYVRGLVTRALFGRYCMFTFLLDYY